jgi:dolichol-phosphate mannosyltransferase
MTAAMSTPPALEETPRVTVILPVYDEGEAIVRVLDQLFDAMSLPSEVLAVYDSRGDTTRPYLEAYASSESRLHPLLNNRGRGPAQAIRFGIEQARAEVVVVTMGDGSDDPQQIDQLARLVERGVVVAAASRYSRGGQRIGGPLFQRTLSRLAGLSLYRLARVGTRDATNGFKGYSVEFLRSVGIESDAGFEMGIELVAKARRLRLPVAEVPTIWLDRTHGISHFRLRSWLPAYLRWWLFAFGPRLTTEQLLSRSPGSAPTTD